MTMPITRNDLSTRLTELNYRLEVSNSTEHSADFQKILNLLISICMISNRILQKQQDDQKIAANERRTQSTTDLANTYKGFGLNFGTGTVLAQPLIAVVGPSLLASSLGIPNKISQVICQGTSQAIGSIKGLTDEAKQGTRLTMQHTVDKVKMVSDDLSRDTQKSQSLIDELMALQKQMSNEEHNTASRMT